MMRTLQLKQISVLLSILFVLFGLMLSWRESGAVESPKMTLRVSTGTTSNHPSTLFLERVSKEVAQRTGDAVKIQVYPDASLFSHDQILDAVMTGTVDMGLTMLGKWATVNPIYRIGDFPFFLDSETTIYKNYDALKEIFSQYDAKSGCKLLSLFPYDSLGIISSKPVITPTDMTGLKIRAPDKSTFDSIQAFGAVPQAMPLGEVYDALSKGAVNGSIIGVVTCNERKWYEVCKYWVTPLGYPFHNVLMNMKKWNGLSKDTQKALMEAVKAAEDWRMETFKGITRQSLEEMQKKGLNVKTLSAKEAEPWHAKMQPIIESWLKTCNTGGSGADAKRIHDMIQKGGGR